MAAKSISIAERLNVTKGRPTGFDYLRIILALGVIIAHSIPLSYGLQYSYQLAATPLGSVQSWIVPMFFALSGFLVAGSLERNHIGVFVGLRLIRIAPALAVEVTLSALLLGPLLTVIPLTHYFADAKVHSYFLNILGDIHYLLPGVFHSNPYPDIVNGQLWTVPIELRCYITLTVLATFGIAKRKYLFLAASVAASVALWVLHHHAGEPPNHAPLFIGFLAGVAIFCFRHIIPWDWRLGLVSLGAIEVLLLLPQGRYFAGFPFAYFTVYLGLLNPSKIALLKGADYSYGLYLYGFAIQQAVARIFPWSHHWYWNLALSIPLASLFAAFSWTLVEKPALKLRSLFPHIAKWGSPLRRRAAA